MQKRPALGVHVFAGGFSLGVSQYFNVLRHLEAGKFGVETVRHNLGVPVHVGEDNWPLDLVREEAPEFVFGNPPCAPWSTYNSVNGKHWRQDPRLEMVRDQFNLLTELQPKVWAWESVTGVWSKGREFVLELAEQAVAQGYRFSVVLHSGHKLGVPQVRKRAFMVAHRVAIDWRLPDRRTPFADEVLKEVGPGGEVLTETALEYWKHLWHHVRPGEQFRKTWLRLLDDDKARKLRGRGPDEPVGRPGMARYRLREGEYANAFLANPVMHPTENRLLTERELLALCSYPPDWEVKGSPSVDARMHQLSRGVMPATGEWLAWLVAEGLEKDRPVVPDVEEVDLIKQDHWTPQQDLFIDNEE